MTQPSPVRSVMFNVLLFRCHCSNQSGSNCNNDFALLYARLGRTRSSLSHVAPKLYTRDTPNQMVQKGLKL